MRNMKLMLTKTPPEDIKQHILPVVYNALDAESSQVQVNLSEIIFDPMTNLELFIIIGTMSIHYSVICSSHRFTSNEILYFTTHKKDLL